MTYTVLWDESALDAATRHLDDPAGLAAAMDAADQLADIRDLWDALP